VPVEKVSEALTPQTALVTVIHVQNEIGTIQPVREIAAAARKTSAFVHADSAQAAGKIVVDVKALGVDLVTVAGHKIYAPKGVGALYVRAGLKLPPLVVGAGQEGGLRPGTENVAFIVGLGTACALAGRMLDSSQKRIAELSTALLELLQPKRPASCWWGIATSGCPIR